MRSATARKLILLKKGILIVADCRERSRMIPNTTVKSDGIGLLLPVRQYFVKTLLLEFFLPALCCGAQALSEFFVANECLSGYRSLIPEMADRRRSVSIFQVDELSIDRKEIARFETCTVHTLRIELYLI